MTTDDTGRIQLPRLGAHLRVWGAGHWCDSGEPHPDGQDCVCVCGVPAPYNEPPGPGDQRPKLAPGPGAFEGPACRGGYDTPGPNP